MSGGEALREGWYLMSTRDLENELERRRSSEPKPRSQALPLSVQEALAYRNAGNLPDDLDRSLRLVLIVHSPEDLERLQLKRLRYEPDFHDAPKWRRAGSRPVNIVPLRDSEVHVDAPESWLDEPGMAELETRWVKTGCVDNMKVPAGYRAFVYKTVLALRAAGRDVTPDAVADSVSRWLAPPQAEELRAALKP